MTTKKQPPKVVPYLVEKQPNGDRLVYVHCPYCQKKHRHGWPRQAGQAAPGHRISHCEDFSLRNSLGYFICAPTRSRTISNGS